MRVWNVGLAPAPVTKVSANGDEITYKWHVIYNAQKKLYTYRFTTKLYLDPNDRHHRIHMYDHMDMDTLGEALCTFEGTHDFRAFAGAVEANQRRSGKTLGTTRTVYKVDLVDEGGGNYRVDFLLKGALYKMVRNMMGSAFKVAQGKMKMERLEELLHHVDPELDVNQRTSLVQFVRKDNKCKPAPPEGLTLERVFFEEDF